MDVVHRSPNMFQRGCDSNETSLCAVHHSHFDHPPFVGMGRLSRVIKPKKIPGNQRTVRIRTDRPDVIKGRERRPAAIGPCRAGHTGSCTTKRAPPPKPVFAAHGSAVALDNRFHQRQAQAYAAFAFAGTRQSVERFEDAAPAGPAGTPGAVVFHPQRHARLRAGPAAGATSAPGCSARTCASSDALPQLSRHSAGRSPAGCAARGAAGARRPAPAPAPRPAQSPDRLPCARILRPPDPPGRPLRSAPAPRHRAHRAGRAGWPTRSRRSTGRARRCCGQSRLRCAALAPSFPSSSSPMRMRVKGERNSCEALANKALCDCTSVCTRSAAALKRVARNATSSCPSMGSRVDRSPSPQRSTPFCKDSRRLVRRRTIGIRAQRHRESHQPQQPGKTGRRLKPLGRAAPRRRSCWVGLGRGSSTYTRLPVFHQHLELPTFAGNADRARRCFAHAPRARRRAR